MGLSWPAKDTDAILDYEVKWAKWLGPGDTIATSVFTFVQQAGLTIDRQDHSDTTSTVWLSGGTPGAQAVLNCAVTTVAGRIDDRTVTINIKP